MKSSWLFLICLFLFSCGSSQKYSGANQHSGAKTSLPAPNMTPRQALPKTNPEGLFQLGQRAYQAKDYAKSFDYFISCTEKFKGTAREEESRQLAARSAGKLGRWSEAIALSNEILANKQLSSTHHAEFTNLKIRALESAGQNLKLLETLVAAIQDPTFTADHESFKLKSLSIIESKLSQGELETVLDDNLEAPIKSAASYRLGEIALQNRDVNSAKSYFQKSISLDAGSAVARQAQINLDQLESLSKVESKTIGVVLPLTGKHAQVAQKTLRGLQMGLGLYGKNISSFKLAVVDDEANPDRASRGVERLVREDNVVAVVGSLVSKTATAVTAKTSEYNIPNIALSQKSGLTEIGNSVFRNSMTSEMQVRELVRYAMEEKGLHKFAIVYPNDPYGIEFTNLFWDEVLARGGEITTAQTYSPKETDFRNVVQRLVGTYYIDARADEYHVRVKDLNENTKNKSSRSGGPDIVLPPIVDFDAVFIPDSAKALGQIAAMLSFNDVRDVTLLGTNLWNVPGISKRAGNWTQNLIFVDSFVSTDPRFQNSTFVRDYKTLFGEEPGIFEIQAYDTALILRQLISQGYSSRESLSAALAKIQNLPGSLSPLSMSSDREVLRPVAVLTLNSGQIVPVQDVKKP